jgi:hypothetical protein
LAISDSNPLVRSLTVLKTFVLANLALLTIATLTAHVPSTAEEALPVIVLLAPYLAIAGLLFAGKPLVAADLSVALGILGFIGGSLYSLPLVMGSSILTQIKYEPWDLQLPPIALANLALIVAAVRTRKVLRAGTASRSRLYLRRASLIFAVMGLALLLASVFLPRFVFAPYQKTQIGDLGRDLWAFSMLATLVAFSTAIATRNNFSATISIPLLLVSCIWGAQFFRACCGSNESSAVAELRTINTAEVTYSSSNQGRYGTVPELIIQGLLGARFAAPIDGYRFSVTPFPNSYSASAFPEGAGTRYQAGRFAYISETDAVIRYSTDPGFAPPGETGLPVH